MKENGSKNEECVWNFTWYCRKAFSWAKNESNQDMKNNFSLQKIPILRIHGLKNFKISSGSTGLLGNWKLEFFQNFLIYIATPWHSGFHSQLWHSGFAC